MYDTENVKQKTRPRYGACSNVTRDPIRYGSVKLAHSRCGKGRLSEWNICPLVLYTSSIAAAPHHDHKSFRACPLWARRVGRE